ncbi:MAG TPA: rhamnulokinase family protein [Microcella sp.]|nr:rhamnulokinase family protein [Microcella sp.]
MGIHVAAIDLGATSGRVMRAVVDAERVELVEVARFPNGPVTRADGLHWDTGALRAHIMNGLRRAFDQDPAITSIGIDSWAVDYALLSNGRELGEPFHYRDERTTRGVAAVHAHIAPDELYRITGLQHLPFNTVFQLAAERERLAQADRMLLIPDLVTFWLTGRQVTEVTNASTTGLLDPHTRQWNDALIEQLGLPRSLFAPLVTPGDDLGPLLPEIVAEVGAPSGVRVTAVGSHDTASAVVAVPMVDDGAAYISCGTWGLVGLELDEPILTAEARDANITNEGGVDGRVRFLRNVTGLWLLSETIRQWEAQGSRIDLPTLLADATAVTESVPIFAANDPRLLAPGRMASRIAELIAETGRPFPASQAAFTRAIIASLAQAFADTLTVVARTAGRDIEMIHLVGGGSLNALLCQLLAERTGLTVTAGPAEATAMGNVLVQARAVGSGVTGATLDELRQLVTRTVVPVVFHPGSAASTA